MSNNVVSMKTFSKGVSLQENGYLVISWRMVISVGKERTNKISSSKSLIKNKRKASSSSVSVSTSPSRFLSPVSHVLVMGTPGQPVAHVYVPSPDQSDTPGPAWPRTTARTHAQPYKYRSVAPYTSWSCKSNTQG